ncbi:MAG TPA: outer membrane beta-barrel protein [Polyangiaceae bacterium]|nr:outer membrane beta-barrel protein [Polyangiaceae bacterium]
MTATSASAKVAALATACLVFGIAAHADAQLLPPPPLQSGGLTPPPPGPTQPGTTAQRLTQASEQDSGRGLEFAYFQVEGGLQVAGLTALHESGTFLPPSQKASGAGGFFGVGAGVRLLYFTVGPRFRLAHFSSWDLWTLNLDLGWHIPLGKLEPYATLGAGYAKLGHSADDLLGNARGVSVSGFDVRLGGGIDYYVTNVFSVGGTLELEMVRLGRSGIALTPADDPAASAFGSDASALGITAAAGAVLGLHF